MSANYSNVHNFYAFRNVFPIAKFRFKCFDIKSKWAGSRCYGLPRPKRLSLVKSKCGTSEIKYNCSLIVHALPMRTVQNTSQTYYYRAF